MVRPTKKIDKEILQEAYLNQYLSTTEISSISRRLFGTYLSSATVYNHLTRLGIPLRSKSHGVKVAKQKKPKINITTIAGRNPNKGSGWNTRYWNARWLIAIGKIKANNSKVTKDQAKLLSKLLDDFGNNNAVPEELINVAFENARRDGFPFITLNPDEQINAWRLLCQAKPIKRNGSFYWDGLQTTLATMFHPHLYDCSKNGKMSPIELFNSDEDLKRAIRKAYCLRGTINNRILNDICRNEDAAGRVGNFPPRVGKAILSEIWEQRTDLDILDPCAGFSGRLFACASSGQVRSYMGIDLSQKTVYGLYKSVQFLRSVGCEMKVTIKEGDCIEELKNVPDNSFDMVLTSPPFFNVEKYVGVELPYDYVQWVSKFVEPMLIQCFRKLRPGGKMALYLEKVGTFDIPRDCIKISEENGMHIHEGVHFMMNYGASRRKEKGRGIKIMVFCKPV